MLYERWCRIASKKRNALALRDLASGRQWTFGELHASAAAGKSEPRQIVCPQGNSAEFILASLRAWRSGQIVCPLETGQRPPSIAPPPSPCTHLKTTSATTGAPRLVAFTSEQLAADADNIIATMGLRPDWPNLGAISMAHSYGFSNLVLPLLLEGIPLIIAPSTLPEGIRSAAETEPNLTLAAVPVLWRAWHEADAIPRNVRLAISAGAPLPMKLEQSVFAVSGIKIHNFYGATECGGIAYDATEAPRTEDGCVGTPMRNVSLSLDADGCLAVRGRAVGETYWPEPADTLGSGQFQTSDLVELKEGVVHLCGRLSDQINIAGRKISPAAIERALLAHPRVDECLVFGVPSHNSDRTDQIVACVVTALPACDEDLKQFLLSRIPAWQVPRRWWFVESLSANGRGKLSRTEWRRHFLAWGGRELDKIQGRQGP